MRKYSKILHATLQKKGLRRHEGDDNSSEWSYCSVVARRIGNIVRLISHWLDEEM